MISCLLFLTYPSDFNYVSFAHFASWVIDLSMCIEVKIQFGVVSTVKPYTYFPYSAIVWLLCSLYSKVVRKSIARVLTVISQTQRDNLRKFYQKKKYKPLDLRPKKTRAKRRELTKFEKSRKTLRQIKKETHFPKRVYAVKQ